MRNDKKSIFQRVRTWFTRKEQEQKNRAYAANVNRDQRQIAPPVTGSCGQCQLCNRCGGSSN